ncbi:MAG: tripartite tricarboxylate transporter substrate-binding protein [Pigmentiphaga sp.]|nr:tripartite tricarboxylate transporter substrate-binding protein [Pigmentiphaga sp.]
MQIKRRRFAASLLCSPALAGLGLAPLAQAATRELRLLVGFAPGGAADTVARVVGDGLRESGYTVIVENRPGAAGRIATEALAKAPADGGTLMMAPSSSLTLAPHIYPKLPYDPLRDFAGVGTVVRTSFAVAVGADSKAHSLAEFLELARREPTLAAYGSPGAGSAMNLIGELLAQQSGVPLTHVPYRGGSAAMTDLINGTLPMLVSSLPNLLPMHRNGRIRILAVSTDEPIPALPAVPTFKTLGFPDLALQEDISIFAPAGTPAKTLTTLHEAVGQAVKAPRVANALREVEYDIHTTESPAALDRQIMESHQTWARIVAQTGFTLDH